MKDVLFVGVGGFIGSVLRYKISTLLLLHSTRLGFPLGTLCVNIAGCFFIGILAGLSIRGSFIGPASGLLLVTGLLGGFTTFSAFGLETLTLLKSQKMGFAVANALLSLCLGLIAVWLGDKLVASR